jgi:hypothetical protein
LLIAHSVTPLCEEALVEGCACGRRREQPMPADFGTLASLCGACMIQR